jgi:general secretion pathway protein I
MNKFNCIKKQLGITLVEVLVAMVIFSVSIAVGMSTLGDSLSATRQLDRMTYAHWAAQNKMTDLLLQPQWPNIGRSSGETEELMGEIWYWSVEVKPTSAKDLRRVEIQVKKDPNFSGYDSYIVGFIGRY